jgi:hypothetical protein
VTNACRIPHTREIGLDISSRYNGKRTINSPRIYEKEVTPALDYLVNWAADNEMIFSLHLLKRSQFTNLVLPSH